MGLLLKALVVSLFPFSGLRRVLYRLLFGFDIPASARIGFLTVLAVPKLRLGERVSIGALNLFKGPIDVSIGAGSRIGRANRFISSWHIMQPRFRDRGYTPRLTIGENALILNEHFFDVYGMVSIGDGTWIAGYGSQFWTHGVSVVDRDISIGAENYIGSAVRFAPGASIGSRNLVALGSVILSKIEADDSLISGFPAKAIRSIAEDVAAGKYRFTFEDW